MKKKEIQDINSEDLFFLHFWIYISLFWVFVSDLWVYMLQFWRFFFFEFSIYILQFWFFPPWNLCLHHAILIYLFIFPTEWKIKIVNATFDLSSDYFFFFHKLVYISIQTFSPLNYEFIFCSSVFLFLPQNKKISLFGQLWVYIYILRSVLTWLQIGILKSCFFRVKVSVRS